MLEYHPSNPQHRFTWKAGRRYFRQWVQNSVRMEIATTRMKEIGWALFQLDDRYTWRAYEEINDHVREGRFS